MCGVVMMKKLYEKDKKEKEEEKLLKDVKEEIIVK